MHHVSAAHQPVLRRFQLFEHGFDEVVAVRKVSLDPLQGLDHLRRDSRLAGALDVRPVSPQTPEGATSPIGGAEPARSFSV